MGFEKRSEEAEAKYRHDEQLSFKIQSRRDYLFGEWAADLFGFRGAEAETYARSMVTAGLEAPGDDDLIRKAKKDGEKHGRKPTREDCLAKLAEFQEQARDEVSSR